MSGSATYQQPQNKHVTCRWSRMKENWQQCWQMLMGFPLSWPQTNLFALAKLFMLCFCSKKHLRRQNLYRFVDNMSHYLPICCFLIEIQRTVFLDSWFTWTPVRTNLSTVFKSQDRFTKIKITVSSLTGLGLELTTSCMLGDSTADALVRYLIILIY